MHIAPDEHPHPHGQAEHYRAPSKERGQQVGDGEIECHVLSYGDTGPRLPHGRCPVMPEQGAGDLGGPLVRSREPLK